MTTEVGSRPPAAPKGKKEKIVEGPKPIRLNQQQLLVCKISISMCGVEMSGVWKYFDVKSENSPKAACRIKMPFHVKMLKDLNI